MMMMVMMMVMVMVMIMMMHGDCYDNGYYDEVNVGVDLLCH